MDPKRAVDLAKEAEKPLSSTLELSLDPLKTRVQKWSGEPDEIDRTEEFIWNVGQDLALYMHRLRERVYGIKTLVFGSQVVPLSEIYEPATLVAIEKYPQSESEQADTTPVDLETLKNVGRRTVIVDSAGMGKSTLAKNLVLREIIDGDLVPLFLELRNIKPEQTLVEALANTLDDLERKFDRDVFNRLLANEKLFIILDGLDEVQSSERCKLFSHIEQLSLVCGRSAIILTARPGIELPAVPRAKFLTIRSLTKEEAASLVRRLDTYASLDIGERLIELFDDVPAEMLETPLLVSLLYRTFGYDNKISKKASSFYNALFNALFDGHDLTKSYFSRHKESCLDSQNFRALLSGFAFLATLEEKYSFVSTQEAINLIKRAEQLTQINPQSADGFLDDLLVAVPLLIQEGTGIRFIHKTIAEYFAAEYLAYSEHGRQSLRQICQTNLVLRYYGTLEFLEEVSRIRFMDAVVLPIAESVLAFPDDTPPIWRSAEFLGVKYVYISGQNNYPEPPPDASPGIRGRWVGHGSTLTASWGETKSEEMRALHRLAWAHVSEPYEREESEEQQQISIDDILNEVTNSHISDRWISVDSPALQSLQTNLFLDELLSRYIVLSTVPAEKQNRTFIAAALSNNKAQEVVAAAKARRNEGELLATLLGGS